MRRFAFGIGVGVLLAHTLTRTSYRFLAKAVLREIERKLMHEPGASHP